MLFLNCSHLQRSPETIQVRPEGKPLSLCRAIGAKGPLSGRSTEWNETICGPFLPRFGESWAGLPAIRRSPMQPKEARLLRASRGTTPGGNMKQWIRGSLGLALMWPVLIAVAQNTNSGNIRGVVTDSAGAVIPGATVKVDDLDKGISRTITTDGAGLYDTGSIVPDHYLITITAPGFQSYVRGPITLRVETATIDAALAVGTAQQQVIVKTDVPLLQTETGAQS